uniref:Uncharacterized protein AlNc14C133G7008 n=1 Tax=Albugo laibachii Nc14 TaxID=890382 RepID=F0WKF6_9STRA|nr:conserved hypothetical protein [Albugo laibachii Nc14]|eukprot:CCA21760.1 conserved hypothetical protein [Albugo laibachii Nc14]
MKYTLFIFLVNGYFNSFRPHPTPNPAGKKHVSYDVEDITAYNKHFLNQLIETIDTEKPHFAVFDHDGTLAFGDISAAIMYEQMLQHSYKIPEDKFISLLSLGYDKSGSDQCLTKGMKTEIGRDIARNPVTFQQLLESLFEDYKILKDRNLKDSDRAIVSNNFYAKLGFYNDGLFGIYKNVDEDLPCRKYIGLSEIPHLWYGLSKVEIQKLAQEAFKNGAERDAMRLYKSTGSLEVEGNHYPALKPFRQQIELVKILQEKEVEVRIVTAAPDLAVKAISEKYGIKPTHVHGVQLKFGTDGCTGVDLTAAPFGDGKAALIKSWSLGKLIFASGDTSSDFALLESVTDPAGIKLIINTLPSSKGMLMLYEQACDARKEYSAGKMPQSRPRVLIQGVDHVKKRWLPTAYSTYDESLKYTHSLECKEYLYDIHQNSDFFAAYSLSTPHAVGVAHSCHGAGHDHGHCNQKHGATTVQSHTENKHTDTLSRGGPEHTHVHDHCEQGAQGHGCSHGHSHSHDHCEEKAQGHGCASGNDDHSHSHDHCEEKAQGHGCSHGHGHSHNHNSLLNRGAVAGLGTNLNHLLTLTQASMILPLHRLMDRAIHQRLIDRPPPITTQAQYLLLQMEVLP